MPVQPEAMFAGALRDFLLRALPAKVTALNLSRTAKLRAPLVGPYTVPAGAKLKLKIAGANGSAAFTATLAAGSRTTAQVVSEINAAAGNSVASADFMDRLLLASVTSPTATMPVSVVLSSESDATAAAGTNAAFGWDAGGNHAISSGLRAPTFRNVMDGFPLTPEFGGNGTINIVLGDRTSTPYGENIRTDMHAVELEVTVLRADPNQSVHSSKEGIQAAVRAIREALLTDAGRQLDNPSGESGDKAIMLVEELAAKVHGRPFQFETIPSVLFDSASIRLRAKIYERAS